MEKKNTFMETIRHMKGRIIYTLDGIDIFSVSEKDVQNFNLTPNEFFKIVEGNNINKKMLVSTI